MKILKRFIQWLLRFFRREQTAVIVDILYSGQHVKDVPEFLTAKTVYLLGMPKHEWLAAFTCPCGCTELIELVLDGKSRPQWKVVLDERKTVSITPSVYRSVGCKSHFFLTDGKIQWC